MFGLASSSDQQVADRRLTSPYRFGNAPLLRRLDVPWVRRPIEVKEVSVHQIAASFRAASNGGGYRRPDPGAIDGPSWILDMIATAHAAEPVRVPDSGVATITNAILCGEGVICRHMPAGPVIVRETLHNAKFDHSLRPLWRAPNGSLQLRGSLRPKSRLVGPHVCLRQIWDGNYGHWLVECLPRLALVAEHHDLTKLKIVVSRGSRAMTRIMTETLGAFGIRREQIVALPRRPVVVEELIYPLPMTVHPWIKAPRVVSILESVGRRFVAGRIGPRRLYVSRVGAGQRHLRNERQVLEALAPYGFTVVRPEDMSFAAQVRIFSGVEIIVGNYGANLTNMVFAPRGVTLFALTSERMVDDFFWDLTNLKGGRYVSLHGKAIGARPDLNSDFRIDIAALRVRLADLLGPR